MIDSVLSYHNSSRKIELFIYINYFLLNDGDKKEPIERFGKKHGR